MSYIFLLRDNRFAILIKVNIKDKVIIEQDTSLDRTGDRQIDNFIIYSGSDFYYCYMEHN